MVRISALKPWTGQSAVGEVGRGSSSELSRLTSPATGRRVQGFNPEMRTRLIREPPSINIIFQLEHSVHLESRSCKILIVDLWVSCKSGSVFGVHFLGRRWPAKVAGGGGGQDRRGPDGVSRGTPADPVRLPLIAGGRNIL